MNTFTQSLIALEKQQKEMLASNSQSPEKLKEIHQNALKLLAERPTGIQPADSKGKDDSLSKRINAKIEEATKVRVETVNAAMAKVGEQFDGMDKRLSKKREGL